MSDDARSHWDDAYTRKADTQVSWFQPVPHQSLALIKAAAGSLTAGVIDIGGGASRLVDGLLTEGYSDLTVLDVSEVALDRSRARLGTRGARVSWIVADITQWQPLRTWDVWHDRAVFHFLTEERSQNSYIAALKQATKTGAAVIMATFALTGPEKCSGLPVQRYSPASLAIRMGTGFSLQDEAAETHQTPFGTTQDFSYAVFRRL